MRLPNSSHPTDQDQTLESCPTTYSLGTSDTLQGGKTVSRILSSNPRPRRGSRSPHDSGTARSTVNSRKGSGMRQLCHRLHPTIHLAGWLRGLVPAHPLSHLQSAHIQLFGNAMSDNFRDWYIDDITFSDVEVLVEGITSEGTSPQWAFSSPDPARYSYSAPRSSITQTPTPSDPVCASKLSMPLHRQLARQHW